MLTIYRAWTDSHHKMIYVLGYFYKKENAKKAVEKSRNVTYGTLNSVCDPDYGIEEIQIADFEHAPD